MAKILVTGVAGFIGSKLAFELAKRGDSVVGIDNLNDYYDVRLKMARLKHFGEGWKFLKMSIDDKYSLAELFKKECFDEVVNLAAQAGVRYSITNPDVYIQSNIVGFFNVLEACRNFNVKRLIFASSSSVYGLNNKVPYREEDKVETPVSLYAATKKSNELMAHCYSKLYGISCVGLRYFTVYGPWGRPDMSPMLFTDAISRGDKIKVYNNGDMLRDFTFIDDIVAGTIRAIDYDLQSKIPLDKVPFKVYNIGCGHPIKLMDFIGELESALGKVSDKEFLPMQPGDVYQTHADTSLLKSDIGYTPKWSLHDGIAEFVRWYISDKNPLT